MNRDEFYALLDQAGHRLGNLAKNSPGYANELYDLIALVEGNTLDRFLHTFELSGLGNAEFISPNDVQKTILKFKNETNSNLWLVLPCGRTSLISISK